MRNSVELLLNRHNILMWHIHKRRRKKEKDKKGNNARIQRGKNINNTSCHFSKPLQPLLVSSTSFLQHADLFKAVLVCSRDSPRHHRTRANAFLSKLHRGRKKEKRSAEHQALCLHSEMRGKLESLESGRQTELSQHAKANPGASSLAHNSHKTWRGIMDNWGNC